MIKAIICLGLALIPFYIAAGFDTRQPKLYLALIFSLALSIYSFYTGKFKAYKNIWFLGFLLYIPINFIYAPHAAVNLFGVATDSFWIIQSFCMLLVFFLAHVTVRSQEFSLKDEVLFLNIILWTGTIMALYSYAQYLGFEQFFTPVFAARYSVHNSAATLGNRTLLAAFLGMIIPIALYLRKYLNAVLLFLSVLLLDSQIVLGAVVISMMFLIGTKHKFLAVGMVSLFIILALILGIGYFNSPVIKQYIGNGNGSDRFPVWGRIIEDLRTPVILSNGENKQFGITGYGLGSFKFMFHKQHPEFSTFYEAHNEYLQILWETGPVGLFLILIGMYTMAAQAFPLTKFNAHLLSSLLCVAVCAGGLFVFQHGAFIFYTLVIGGLLNKGVKYGD